MLTITIVDPSLATENLGDEIVMEAVTDTLCELFPSAYFYRVPSHLVLSGRVRRLVKKSDLCFIGGTNLLSCRLSSHSQWRIRWFDTMCMSRAVCLGVGWNDYSPDAGARTRLLMQSLLDRNAVHSVRDAYTAAHVANAGIRCVNTSCPTMWGLTAAHCRRLPRRRARDVVFTLTAWRAGPEADRAFVDLLRRLYRRVHFFSQQREDYDYLQRLGSDRVRLVTPTTRGFTEFLASEDVDYVGTRLHGGIRALQQGRRSLILSVDNRALEICRDTSLPVLERTARTEIEQWIEGDHVFDIRLPLEAIDAWKAQFGYRAEPAPLAVASSR
jgi:polysaccharide pyruvyl transferase WcaK-like protein